LPSPRINFSKLQSEYDAPEAGVRTIASGALG